jgi:hypothetical protein
VHAKLQAAFDGYFTKAQICFVPSGLAPTAGIYLWKRALLTVGDYLASSGSNCSFLTDPQRSWDSWKRFLGGTRGARQFLKILWDQIDANALIEPQLRQILASADSLEPWRAAIVKHPQVIDYCGQQEMRRGANDEEIYLLRKRQMSGYHAELFSYVLNLELDDAGGNHNLTPLRLQPYQSVYLSDLEPHVHLVFDRPEHRVNFSVESSKGQFRIYTGRAELDELPEVETALCGEATFVKEDERLTRVVPRADIHKVLQKVAQTLANLRTPS